MNKKYFSYIEVTANIFHVQIFYVNNFQKNAANSWNELYLCA